MSNYEKINNLDLKYKEKRSKLLIIWTEIIKINIKYKKLSYRKVAVLAGVSFQTVNNNLNGIVSNIEIIKVINDIVNNYKK